MKNHPNALIGGLLSGSGLGSLVLWALNSEAHLGVPAAGCAAIAGGITFVVLYVGRKGIAGTIDTIWNGSK